MKNTHDLKSDEAWDKRELGASEAHVRKASSKREKALDDRLGLQTISIRLQKSLIDNLKRLADDDGIGYQPYVRQVLMRHVRQIDHERKEKAKRDKSLLGAREALGKE
jgi:predicted DNA binding CopG/RHH family protein